MADVEKIAAELRENLASFDAEVAYELENDGERADLWTDIDVPVEGLRAVLDELSRLREAERALDDLQSWVRQSRIDLQPLDPDFHPKYETLKAIGAKIRAARVLSEREGQE